MNYNIETISGTKITTKIYDLETKQNNNTSMLQMQIDQITQTIDDQQEQIYQLQNEVKDSRIIIICLALIIIGMIIIGS